MLADDWLVTYNLNLQATRLIRYFWKDKGSEQIGTCEETNVPAINFWEFLNEI